MPTKQKAEKKTKNMRVHGRVYRVWICVEEENEKTDTYEDIDLGGGPVFVSEDRQEAIAYAEYLQKSAE